MTFPSFIPLPPQERRKRQIIGFAIEMLVWAYFVIFLAKTCLTLILLPFIETLAYNDPPNVTALLIIDKINFDSRYFEFPWALFFLLIIFGMFIGFLISLKAKGFGSWIASFSKLQVQNPEDSLKVSKHWKFARFEAYALIVVSVITGWVLTDISFAKIFQIDGLLGAGRLSLQLSCGIPGIGAQVGSYSIFEFFQWILNSFVKLHNLMFSNYVPPLSVNCEPNDLTYFSKAIGKLAESIYLAFIATFFSVPVAFVLSFFASRNLTRHNRGMRFIYFCIRSYMNITRSIEPLIWAILFSVWLGIGPFAGSMALMIHSISSLVKQYSEAVEGVEEGPIEAIQATGANRIAVVWYAVVPQILIPYLAFTIYRWDINMRMATIIGLVGGGGIGSILIQEQMLARWTQVGSIAFLIFLVVWIMDFLSARIREAIQ